MIFAAKNSQGQNVSSSDDSISHTMTSHSATEGASDFSDDSSVVQMDSDQVAHVRSIMTRSKTRMALMRHHLSNGQRVLHKTRCRISGSFLILGLICSVCVIFEFSRQESLEEMGALSTSKYIDQGVFGILLYFFQISCCCLAPMADDPRLTRWALLQLCLVAMLAAIFLVGPTLLTYLENVERQNSLEGSCELYGTEAPNTVCDMKLVQLVLRLVSLGVLIIANFVVTFFQDAANMQRAMWGIATIFISMELSAVLLYTICVAVEMHLLDPMSMRLIGMIPALLLSRMKMVRSKVQIFISHILRYRNNRAAAAGIAGLVGNCSISEVMHQAKKRFRSVDFSKLEERELATNRPSPAVFALSQSVKLGSCDAFVSHSWHDDAPAKWEAMNCWRQRFEKNRKRPPQIWLDKCCIDQNDIEADLRCLPIFLSGCSELVVFCGPTYLSRLWCIMELFTFVHIGGKPSDINVIPVLRRGQELEDRSAMRQSFLDFDVLNCECFNTSDKEKMLDIIQMAFGDLGKFNESVRSILHAIDWMRTCPREWLISPMSSPAPSKSPLSALSSPLPKCFPEVPDDSPIPSIPSPRKRRMAPGLAASPMVASSPRILPEDSPIPSMPSPKEYQWLN
eukprot:s2006_g3.t1